MGLHWIGLSQNFTNVEYKIFAGATGTVEERSATFDADADVSPASHRNLLQVNMCENQSMMVLSASQ